MMYTITRFPFARFVLASVFLGALGRAGTAHAQDNAAQNEVRAARAGETLRQALQQESAWIKVHAAEALVAEGDVAPVDALLAVEPAEGPGKFPRVGRWRLQARRAPSEEQRRIVLARIEAVFLDPAGAPDEIQALETLCKLGAAGSAAVRSKARLIAADGTERDAMFATWFLALAGERETAVPRLVQALGSEDEISRLRAAYALRWLDEKGGTALSELARAADREPRESLAYPYVIAAAYRLQADPMRVAVWRGLLGELVRNGSAGARYEVAQVLLGEFTAEELAAWEPLLDETSDHRIAAAWVLVDAGRKKQAAVK